MAGGSEEQEPLEDEPWVQWVRDARAEPTEDKPLTPELEEGFRWARERAKKAKDDEIMRGADQLYRNKHSGLSDHKCGSSQDGSRDSCFVYFRQCAALVRALAARQ
jgi:hypothetical protein